MKYDREFFHQQLLRLQCVNYDKYSDYEDIDVLTEYISEEKISDYDAIVWTEFKQYFVSAYNIGSGQMILDDQQIVTADEIQVGFALEKLMTCINPLAIRIKVLIYLRDNANKIFDKPTIGLESFESEIVRLISKDLRKEKDNNLYDELLNLVQSGIYNPIENTKEPEIVTLKKQNKELERENRRLDSDLTALQKKYDELKTLWDNRNKRKKSIQYGIPSELQTDAAQWIIEKLQEKGYIRILRLTYNDAPIYNWEKSKSLFAYFVERLTYHLELRDTNEQIPWKIFEGAFIYGGKLDPSFHKGLKDIVSKYHKSGKIPQNDDVIERILKEAKEKPWLKNVAFSQ